MKDTINASYKEALQNEHQDENWGTTGARYSGYALRDVLRRGYLQSVLDYGAGKGTMAQEFPELQWTEYDPGIPGKDVKPHVGSRFDLVVCTDVMEHVEGDKVDAVIAELATYTGTVLFVDIACYPTGKLFESGPYAGQDLHITLETPEWWIAKFDQAGLQKHQTAIIEKRTKGGYRERVQLTYERV